MSTDCDGINPIWDRAAYRAEAVPLCGMRCVKKSFTGLRARRLVKQIHFCQGAV